MKTTMKKISTTMTAMKKKNEVNDKGVMEVIKEQMKGILKLIKTSTGRDISDDGNIIIAYTNVFQVKPRKNTH